MADRVVRRGGTHTRSANIYEAVMTYS